MKLGLALLERQSDASAFLSSCELVGEAASRGADLLLFPSHCFEADPLGERANLFGSFAKKHGMAIGYGVADSYFLIDSNGASHRLKEGDRFSVKGILFERVSASGGDSDADRLVVLPAPGEDPYLSSGKETYVLTPFLEASCYKEKELLCSLPSGVKGLFLKTTS